MKGSFFREAYRLLPGRVQSNGGRAHEQNLLPTRWTHSVFSSMGAACVSERPPHLSCYQA